MAEDKKLIDLLEEDLKRVLEALGHPAAKKAKKGGKGKKKRMPSESAQQIRHEKKRVRVTKRKVPLWRRPLPRRIMPVIDKKPAPTGKILPRGEKQQKHAEMGKILLKEKIPPKGKRQLKEGTLQAGKIPPQHVPAGKIQPGAKIPPRLVDELRKLENAAKTGELEAENADKDGKAAVRMRPPPGKQLKSLLEVKRKVKEVLTPAERKRKHVPTAVPVIYTDADWVVDIVRQRGEISLREIQERLGVSEDVVAEWARILDEQKVLELHYPENPFAPPILRLKGYKRERRKNHAKAKKAK